MVERVTFEELVDAFADAWSVGNMGAACGLARLASERYSAELDANQGSGRYDWSDLGSLEEGEEH